MTTVRNSKISVTSLSFYPLVCRIKITAIRARSPYVSRFDNGPYKITREKGNVGKSVTVHAISHSFGRV